ncbi:hypothetical protein [Streptomyces sp. NTH33]|uniref:hypothetical protein n=1 Tax=Streptomyces sp. NTH33 TaxID=1735453 RepID=UPI0015E8A209|nr:hypothetical protein [Streptomyces sp. NTH33]
MLSRLASVVVPVLGRLDITMDAADLARGALTRAWYTAARRLGEPMLPAAP